MIKYLKLFNNKIMENINKSEEISELTKAEKKEIKKEVKEILKEKSKSSNTSSYIKTEVSKEEKIVSYFDKIEFLSLDDKEKEEVAIKLKKDSTPDKLYWIEIFLSSTIAALWLLQNSVAVVIWAMLIAPLLRPINWLWFSVARWGQKFFLLAFKTLFYSILLSIFMWYIITVVSWLNIETTEITSRTNPNIIDFFIAIFSAMVAVMSIRFSRLWEWIAWVAMAASLMPPLAVIGIELALWNYMSSFGALMLFWANLLAILIVSTIFFWLYWFTPHDTRLQSKVFKRIWIVTFFITILLIPLLLSFNTVKTNATISSQLNTYLSNIIESDLKYYEISDIYVVYNNKKEAKLRVTLKVPEWYNMQKILDNVYFTLSDEFSKDVSIDFEIIRTINISTK